MNQDMINRIQGDGFIAALDQSGGSTPKALAAYGITEDAWSNEEEMFDLIHRMRTRIIVNSSFDHRISGAILFERTMNSEVEGMSTAKYLWEKKNIVPFLKVDEGLQDQDNGVQLMKEMKGLAPRLSSAVEHGIFGTKMRSVIHEANPDGIADIVKQQFEVGMQILDAGLMPILEPEVNIHAEDKAEIEEFLKEQILFHLDGLEEGVQVMLKLTLPEEANFYNDLVNHPAVLRVVALSGGYSREVANQKLSENTGITASFSRALVQDLQSGQSDDQYTQSLDTAIESIYTASVN